MNDPCYLFTPSYSGEVACGMFKPLSVREQLEVRLNQLTEQLNTTKAALAALNENPGVEKVLDLVGRSIRY